MLRSVLARIPLLHVGQDADFIGCLSNAQIDALEDGRREGA